MSARGGCPPSSELQHPTWRDYSKCYTVQVYGFVSVFSIKHTPRESTCEGIVREAYVWKTRCFSQIYFLKNTCCTRLDLSVDRYCIGEG